MLNDNKVLVLDLEFTCWAENSRPKDQFREIIEIGISEINLTSHTIDISESFIIKPQNSTISKYCEDLTGITQYKADKGIFLNEGLTILKENYLSDKRSWFSWGPEDKLVLENQCLESNIEYSLSTNFDLKSLFSIFYGLNKEISLLKALDYLNLSFKGKVHSGKDDSYNTGLILIEMLKKFKVKL